MTTLIDPQARSTWAVSPKAILFVRRMPVAPDRTVGRPNPSGTLEHGLSRIYFSQWRDQSLAPTLPTYGEDLSPLRAELKRLAYLLLAFRNGAKAPLNAAVRHLAEQLNIADDNAWLNTAVYFWLWCQLTQDQLNTELCANLNIDSLRQRVQTIQEGDA